MNHGEFSLQFFPSLYPKFFFRTSIWYKLHSSQPSDSGLSHQKNRFQILHFLGNKVSVWCDVMNPMLDSPKETYRHLLVTIIHLKLHLWSLHSFPTQMAGVVGKCLEAKKLYVQIRNYNRHILHLWSKIRYERNVNSLDHFLSFPLWRNSLCTFCKSEVESLIHLFLYSRVISQFWQGFRQWMIINHEFV